MARQVQYRKYTLSSKGMTFIRGEALGEEMRCAIVDKIMNLGGDMATGFFPGSFIEVANHFQIWPETVRKVWILVCSEGTVNPGPHKTGNPAHIKPEDVELVEFLKRERPSISYSSVKEKLEIFGNIEGGTSVSAIGRTVRSRMSDGPWTWKKLTKQPMDKFTDGNITYAQQFLQFLHGMDPVKVKYFDEAGVNVATGHRSYGHSLKGTNAVEILNGQSKGANYTLNLLCGLEGVLYANTVFGGADTYDFLNFWSEAVEYTTPSGLPVLDNGDVIVYDNAAIHRFEGGQAVASWLNDMGIAVIYTPIRSPEFNAVELVFNKLKTMLKRDEYAQLLHVNVPAAIFGAISTISEADMTGFYRYVNYFQM
jgi:hypothetical protein